MGLLRSVQADDARRIAGDTNGLAEDVVYHDLDSATRWTVPAIVFRGQVKPLHDDDPAPRGFLTIAIDVFQRITELQKPNWGNGRFEIAWGDGKDDPDTGKTSIGIVKAYMPAPNLWRVDLE